MPNPAVGEPFPGLSFPTPGGAAGEYLYYDAGHELRLFLSRPSAREIESVRSGEAKFGLLYEEDLICIAYRFGDEPVSEAMYSWHLVPEERRQASLPAAQRSSGEATEERALLTVVLTDAGTGIVRVLRAVTFSPEFTRGLHERIREQARAEPIGLREYHLRARKIQAKYPTSDVLMAAADYYTRGGE